MLIQCNNKGCGQLAEVKLDPATNEVICMECSNPIKSVTNFVKANLRANKQFVKKGTGSNFNVKCAKCGRTVGPVLDEKNQIVCPNCNALITLSKAFENVFRQSNRKAGGGNTK